MDRHEAFLSIADKALCVVFCLLVSVPHMQRRVQAKPLNWYMKNYSSRDEGIVSAYVSGDYLMKDIADEFNVHYSTVSRAIKKAAMHDCKT